MATAPESVTPSKSSKTRVVLAALAVGVLVAGVVFALTGGGGGDDQTPVASGAPDSTTSSTVAPATVDDAASTSLEIGAPPPRARVTTTQRPTSTAPVTTAPPTSTTSTTTVTASTAPSATSTTTSTTAPPRPVQARPGITHQSTSGDHANTSAAIAAARAEWDSIEVPRGYIYRTERVCFCPVAINDVSVNGRGVVDGQENVDGDEESQPPTIDDLFDLLDAAVARDAASIRVSFDERFSYPVEFAIDYEELLADDEQGRNNTRITIR